MSKDRGWDYLNSSGEDFDYDKDNDGSWGYENDDGSGSFYGADGSWGYKNSDGSASYYGADGSWGYKNADGSGSYYGNDGSWGYTNQDGSGTYYDENGDAEYSSSDDDDNETDYSSSSGDSGDSVFGTLLGLGLAAYGISKLAKSASRNTAYKDDDEDEEDDDEDDDDDVIDSDYADREQIRRFASYTNPASEDADAIQAQANLEKTVEQMRQFKQGKKDRIIKKIKHFFITILVIMFLCVAAYGGFKYWEFTKRIETGVSSTELIALDYEEAEKVLSENGFTNIDLIPVSDLELKDKSKENTVISVSIADDTEFDDNDKYPYDKPVKITYHTLKSVTVPISSKKAKKMNYLELEQLFRDAGFEYITEQTQEDLITGWITKDGSVESVSINGETSFSEDASYRVDAEIIITYHTFGK